MFLRVVTFPFHFGDIDRRVGIELVDQRAQLALPTGGGATFQQLRTSYHCPIVWATIIFRVSTEEVLQKKG